MNSRIEIGTKAVVLAGGLGTRLAEETQVKPKPMVEIGGRPILWHIMKIYSHYGINDFVVCVGYKGYVIKEYFANYFLHMSDVTFDMKNNNVEIHDQRAEPWRVTIVDTGDDTYTGGRLRRVRSHLEDAPFCMTYGDGVADIDLAKLTQFHHEQNREATLTAVRPPGRYGSLEFSQPGHIARFHEKPTGDGGSINGGFFMLNPSVIDLIDGDYSSWEQTLLPQLADAGQLSGYDHDGFWHPMDTLRDKLYLEDLWSAGKAPWKTWK